MSSHKHRKGFREDQLVLSEAYGSIYNESDFAAGMEHPGYGTNYIQQAIKAGQIKVEEIEGIDPNENRQVDAYVSKAYIQEGDNWRELTDEEYDYINDNEHDFIDTVVQAELPWGREDQETPAVWNPVQPAAPADPVDHEAHVWPDRGRGGQTAFARKYGKPNPDPKIMPGTYRGTYTDPVDLPAVYGGDSGRQLSFGSSIHHDPRSAQYKGGTPRGPTKPDFETEPLAKQFQRAPGATAKKMLGTAAKYHPIGVTARGATAGLNKVLTAPERIPGVKEVGQKLYQGLPSQQEKRRNKAAWEKIKSSPIGNLVGGKLKKAEQAAAAQLAKRYPAPESEEQMQSVSDNRPTPRWAKAAAGVGAGLGTVAKYHPIGQAAGALGDVGQGVSRTWGPKAVSKFKQGMKERRMNQKRTDLARKAGFPAPESEEDPGPIRQRLEDLLTTAKEKGKHIQRALPTREDISKFAKEKGKHIQRALPTREDISKFAKERGEDISRLAKEHPGKFAAGAGAAGVLGGSLVGHALSKRKRKKDDDEDEKEEDFEDAEGELSDDWMKQDWESREGEGSGFKVGDWVWDDEGMHASIVNIDGDEIDLYDGKEGWTVRQSEISHEQRDHDDDKYSRDPSNYPGQPGAQY